MKEGIFIGLFIIALVFSVGFIFYTAGEIADSNRHTKAGYTKPIGQSVVVNNDTLEIVSGSRWRGTFTLSNGIEVDSSFIKNKVLNQLK